MDTTPPHRRPPAWLLPTILVVATGLRFLNAARASFHLDDFHSLHHAQNLAAGGFWERVLADNHPPLSFLILGAFRALLGEGELVLRLPSLIYGVLGVWLAHRVGRRFAGESIGLATAALVALSSLHLELSSDLRMYALLALTGLGLLHALLRSLDGERAWPELALWVALGLHTHYQFLHALGILGLGTLAALAVSAERGRRVRDLALGVGLGALLSLPWYLLGFRAQLAHDLAPGLSRVDALEVVEGFVHLEYLELSLAGAGPRWVFLAAGLVFLGLASLGTLLALRAQGGVRRAAWFPVVAAAWALPVWTALVALWMPRAGFAWRYLAVSIGPFAALAAAGALLPGPGARSRRAAGAFALAAALPLALINALDPGEEDYRGAVVELVGRLAPGDALVAADWQPRIFPHGVGWNYYGPRLLDGHAAPTLLEHDEHFALLHPEGLDGHPRVFCLTRSLPDSAPLLRTLRERLDPVGEPRVFGRSIWLFEFRRR